MSHSSTRTTWRYFYYTPVWDMLRGAEPQRMDWQGTIQQANLPQSLKQFLRSFVRGCWLWATERRDIARELINHFEDGLATGRTADELLADFGDPRLARKLITRAKRRQRPLRIKAAQLLGRMLLTLMLLIVVLTSLQVLRVRLRSPVIETNYWERMQQHVPPATADQSAWPLYEQAMLAFDTNPPRFDVHPSSITDPNIMNWVESQRAVLNLIRVASQRPQMGVLMVKAFDEAFYIQLYPDAGFLPDNLDKTRNPPLMFSILPPLVSLRSLANVLSLTALKASAESNADSFYQDVHAMLQMSRHLQQGGIFTIEHLIALSIYCRAMDTIGYSLADQPQLLSSVELRDLAHRIAATMPPLSLERCLTTEADAIRDLIQRLYSPGPEGRPTKAFLEQICNYTDDPYILKLGTFLLIDSVRGQHLKSMPVFGDLFALTAPSRGKLEQSIQEWMQIHTTAFATPLWLRNPLDDHVWRKQSTPVTADLLSILAPSLINVSALLDQARLRREVVITAIALELYHRHHNRYPASLDELTPHWLPRVPIDPYCGQPVRYRLTRQIPILYSVGVDGDDDAASPAASGALPGGGSEHPARDWRLHGCAAWRDSFPDREAIAKLGVIPDGDWVIWPPE